MGCDIHLYVEQRQPDGTWLAVKGKNPRIDDYRHWAAKARERGEEDRAKHLEEQADQMERGTYQGISDGDTETFLEYDAPEIYKDWVWNGRNYNLFAILANVRNGRGFAGIKTGEGFNPIAKPKGLPADVSEYVKGRSASWDGDGHSHSWHTVADLLAYDWSQTTSLCGFVSESEYKTFKEKGSPESWCGDVSGQMVRHVSPEEMDAILAGEFAKTDGLIYYTRVQWTETYADAAGSFYDEAIPTLKELAGDDPTSVRIVFFFDN